MAKHLFKVWTLDHARKAFVLISEENVYENLIKSASEKLGILGKSFVLEADGTPIVSDDILIAVKENVLILLEENQYWDSNPICANESSLQFIKSEPSDLTISNCSMDSNSTVHLDLESNIQILNVDSISNVEYIWSTFEIPWKSIPNEYIELCERGCREKRAITEIVHIVVDKMREVSTRIPSKAFKMIAMKMVQKYPDMFQDKDDDGHPVSNGYISLFNKLYERSSYKRRSNVKRSVQEYDDDIEDNPKYLKKKKNAMAGCSRTAWAPALKEHNSSQDILIVNNATEENENLLLLLEKTYPLQRKFLNNIENPPTMSDIKKDWRILLKPIGIKFHFQKLTGIDLGHLKDNLKKKANKIFTFSKTLKKIASMDDAEPSKAITFLASYFKDDLSKFWIKVKANESDGNFEQHVNLLSPCFVEFNQKYMLFYEKENYLIVDDILDAFMYSFGLYYNFNLPYPKEISNLLEMFQRYYLKIHPEAGTKSKVPTSGKKVINLINKLRNMEQF